MVALVEWLARVERWVLPAECMQCQRALPANSDALVCDVCRARWRPIDPPSCQRCGEPIRLDLACRICADWPPELGPVRSAVQLEDHTRNLVHRLKYQGWRRMAEIMAPAMHHALEAPTGADLVPIPLARRRQRERGYNQAEQLARALSAETGIPIRTDRLLRIRETASQVRLAPEGRAANVAGAFVAKPCDRPAILVDDVFTTGATLLSAASALIEAGAGSVAGITFARARQMLADQASRLQV